MRKQKGIGGTGRPLVAACDRAMALQVHAGALNAITRRVDPDVEICRCAFADGVKDSHEVVKCGECGNKPKKKKHH